MFFKSSGQPDPKRPKLAVDSGENHGECSSSGSEIAEDQGDNGGTAKASEASAPASSSTPVRGNGEREDVATHEGEAECGEIWTKEQFKEKQKTYPWLTVGKTGLGCATCKEVGSLGPDKTAGMRLVKEWVSGTVKSSAPGIAKQKRALRKKICEHRNTKVHEMASEIVNKAKEDALTNIIINNDSDHIQTTTRIFRTAYKEAKRHRPAYGFEHEIDCQEMNGLNMGRILHSNVACSRIQQHIATDMKKKLMEKIVTCAPKIGLMLDEATGLNRKSALIVYLRVQLPEMESPENIFFELIELDDFSAEGIVRKLLESLHRANFNEEFLSKTLVALTCDGASVMLGRKSGVAVRLQSLFPNLVVWHCAAHRLELAVGDVVKEMAAVNHFKMFMDKLYSLYSTSNKNRVELKECADALDVQLCKIGRVLDTRWVALSLRAVEAVWKSYPALHRHFTQAAQDSTRGSTTRETYNGLAKRLSSHSFVTNLGLMYDALQELSELSLELQKRECNIMMSHKAISRQIRVFEARSTQPAEPEWGRGGLLLWSTPARRATDRQNAGQQGIFCKPGKKFGKNACYNPDIAS